MSDLRQAAQMALDALELSRLNGQAGLCKNEVADISEAIDALRAALAAEPEHERGPGWCDIHQHYKQCEHNTAKQPQPVALVVALEGTPSVRLEWASVEAAHNAKPGPLYTAAPAAHPLPEVIPLDWAGIDPALAFHLIERHAENWDHAGKLMEAWRLANTPTAQPLTERIHDLLWGLHPECCGRPEIGASYGGQQELVCCGCPDADLLNDSQIVSTLRALFPEKGGTHG